MTLWLYIIATKQWYQIYLQEWSDSNSTKFAYKWISYLHERIANQFVSAISFSSATSHQHLLNRITVIYVCGSRDLHLNQRSMRSNLPCDHWEDLHQTLQRFPSVNDLSNPLIYNFISLRSAHLPGAIWYKQTNALRYLRDMICVEICDTNIFIIYNFVFIMHLTYDTPNVVMY